MIDIGITTLIVDSINQEEIATITGKIEKYHETTEIMNCRVVYLDSEARNSEISPVASFVTS
jgi:hypothetical protein